MANKIEKVVRNWTEYKVGWWDVDFNSLEQKDVPSTWDYLVLWDSWDGYANKRIPYSNLAAYIVSWAIGWTWADWDKTINTTNCFLEAKEWNFNNLTICSGSTLRFCWDWIFER